MTIAPYVFNMKTLTVALFVALSATFCLSQELPAGSTKQNNVRLWQRQLNVPMFCPSGSRVAQVCGNIRQSIVLALSASISR